MLPSNTGTVSHYPALGIKRGQHAMAYSTLAISLLYLKTSPRNEE